MKKIDIGMVISNQINYLISLIYFNIEKVIFVLNKLNNLNNKKIIILTL